MDSPLTIAVVLMLTSLLALTLHHVEGCGGCGPSPKNGQWGEWSTLSHCENGYRYKRRHCDSPSPANGGSDCKGPSKEVAQDCVECEDNNGGCEHICVNAHGSYICTCRQGYRQHPYNWKKCERITCARSDWPTPDNGQTSCEDEERVGSGTTCTAKCSQGYTINGPRYSRCGNDGRWHPSESPNCEATKCSKLDTPNKGEINPVECTSAPLHGQLCNFKCQDGYEVNGAKKTQCDNENWTEGKFLSCQDRASPSFGETCPSKLSVIADKGKTTAKVIWKRVRATDNSGHAVLTTKPDVKSPYEFSEGEHVVTYTATDGSRNTGKCFFRVKVKVIRCPVLTPPENGKFATGTGACLNVYGIVCRFMCNKGYDLKGPTSTSCTDKGQWSGNETKCEAVRCPVLVTPEQAIKTGYGCNDSTSRYGSSCFFTCRLGYKAVGGSRKRTCQADGQWTGTMLQCQAVRCPPITFKSEGLVIKPPVCMNSSVDLAYETDCRFTCREGYQLVGPWRKTCDQYNRWSPTTNPSCKDVSGPTFLNCPQNIFNTADRGTTSVLVRWSPPTATDNSGFIPNVTHLGKRPGERLYSGEYSIRYLASDKVGNVGECQFKVIVSGTLGRWLT